MSQLDSSGNIADGIDPRNIGHVKVIYDNPSIFHLDTDIRIKESFRIRNPSYGYQDSIHVNLLILPFIHKMASYAILLLCHPFQYAFPINADSAVRKGFFQRR